MSTIKLLENLIGYYSTKNNVISKNLANIGTENYNREDVVFKDMFDSQLNKNLKATSQRHITSDPSSVSGPSAEIVEDPNTDMTSGINNVDLDREMADLAENTLHFKFSARKIGDYYKNLQKVIRGNV